MVLNLVSSTLPCIRQPGPRLLKRCCTYRPSVIYLIANKLLYLSLSLSVRERNRQTEREREREKERERREGERRVCVSRRRQARVHASSSSFYCSSRNNIEHLLYTCLGSILNWSCLVSIHPCPMSIFTSSSSSFSSLSRGQEHQTQPPTLVTPIPILLSPLSSVPGYMHHRYMRCTTGLG